MIMNTDLTIVVCSNRIDNIDRYTRPLISELGDLYSLVILIDSEADVSRYGSIIDLAHRNNVDLELTSVSGLSSLRNVALERCSTKYILFVDDDVTLDSVTVIEILKNLKHGFQIVGLRLMPPPNKKIDKWYITENQYHYLGIHSRKNKNSIWGACMAFDLAYIHSKGLLFREDLSRKGKSFISGEDTSFIQSLKESGAKSVLLTDVVATHHVDKNRLRFHIFTKRVFWQGVTESIRHNVKGGTRKELKRNLSIIATLKYIFIGLLWMSVFLTGIAYGKFHRVRNIRKKVLFICTGNYYRSRLAEIYFNHLAQKNELPWRAISRGFWTDNPDNKGPISKHVSDELNRMGISYSQQRMPVTLSRKDLAEADLVIAVNEPEHRPYIERHFTEHKRDLLYWNIPDQQEMQPIKALQVLRKEIENLIDTIWSEENELKRHSRHPRLGARAKPLLYRQENLIARDQGHQEIH